MQLPKKVEKELQKAMEIRSRAKALESEAKILTETSKAIILPILVTFDIKKYQYGGIGTVSLKHTTRSSLDRDKLKENLLIAGVDIAIIDRAIDGSTKTTESEFIEFRPEGGS